MSTNNAMIKTMLRDGDGINKRSAPRAQQFEKTSRKIKQDLKQSARNKNYEYDYDEV